MDYTGVWRPISMQTLDMETFEMVWMPVEDVLKTTEEAYKPMRLFANGFFLFNEDGSMKAIAEIPKDVEPEQLEAAKEEGQIEEIDGTPFIKLMDMQWKEEDGVLKVNDGSHTEIFGEVQDPWKAAQVVGKTLIVMESYQIARIDDFESEPLKTEKKAEAKEVSGETKNAAGSYKGLYTKFVCDTEKDESKEFRLELREDGTGMSYRDDLEIKIPEWKVEDGKVTLTEKFLGQIDYVGTLDGTRLSIFNDDPEKPLACEYVFEKM